MEQKKYYKRITNGSFYIGGKRYQKDEVFEAYPRQISSNFIDIIKQVNEDGTPFTEDFVAKEPQKVVEPVKEQITIISNNEPVKQVEATKEPQNDKKPKAFLKSRSKTWFDVVDENGEKLNDKALKEDKAIQLVDLLNSQE